MSKLIIAFIALTFFVPDLLAQTPIATTKDNWNAVSGDVSFEDGSIHLVNNSENHALLWLSDMNFADGSIELDLKGKDVRGESFVGVAFHGADNDNYEVVYFRPFNFKDAERANHSVQYVDLPKNDWSVLREKFPNKYENTVTPVPDPNTWFHARIEVQSPEIKVFVNNAKTPSLVVQKLSTRKEGKLGLWIDSKDGWFKNVVVGGVRK